MKKIVWSEFMRGYKANAYLSNLLNFSSISRSRAAVSTGLAEPKMFPPVPPADSLKKKNK